MTGTVSDLQEAATEKVTVNVNGQAVTLYKGVIVLLVLAMLVMAGWFVWLTNKPVERAGQTVEAKAAAEVKNVPTVAAPVKGGAVQAYPKQVKKKLTLPQSVQDDDRKVVVAASKVAASDRPHTVTTLIDTETGKAETYVRDDPLPWVAFRSSGAIGIGTGVKRGGQMSEIYWRQDIVQFKAIVVSGRLFANHEHNGGRNDAGAMVNAELRY